MPKLFIKRRAIKKPELGYALLPIGADAKHGYAKIDLDDCWVDEYFWTIDSNGYPSCAPDRKSKRIYLHRLVMGDPKRKLVDHKNRDILDARKSNLRAATFGQNTQNRRGRIVSRFGKRTSVYKGVSYVNKVKGRPWQFALDYGDKRHYGYTCTEVEAALRYNLLARKYHKEFAVLNEVEGYEQD